MTYRLSCSSRLSCRFEPAEHSAQHVAYAICLWVVVLQEEAAADVGVGTCQLSGTVRDCSAFFNSPCKRTALHSEIRVPL